jgi:PKD repeat protein
MAPALGQGDVDSMAPTFSKPYQVQVGRGDSWFHDVSLYSYQSFRAPKACLDIAGVGHGGPFQWDLAISFFFRHLLNLTAYDTFLYGESAMNDTADTRYFLNFTLPDGMFFPPNITVRADELSPREDQTVHFAVTYDGFLPLGHPRGTFRWDFLSDGTEVEDGPNETEASHSFRRAGTVRPSVWYVLGGLELGTNTTLLLTVSNPPPKVSAGGNLTASEDEPVLFRADASDTPSDNGTLVFSWDFGDGTVSPFRPSGNATHAYARSGEYTVKLSVRDDEGAMADDPLAVTVRNLAPSAAAGSDITANMDTEVLLTGAGNDTPSDVLLLQFRWDFGDGGSSDWSAWPSASHTYTREGNFTAVFFVTDDDGAAANAATAVRISDVPPSVVLTAPGEGATFPKDEEVDFGGSGGDTPSDAGSLEYSWDFGDLNGTGWGRSAHATHTYTRGGNYTAVLTVRDREGANAMAAVDFTVVNQPPTVRLSAPSGGTVVEDQSVRFSAEGEDTPSDIGALNYTWLIDGAILHGQTVEAAFTTEGSHALTVTVTDPEGAVASAFGTILVTNPAPELAARFGPSDISVNSSVNFSATATDTSSDQPTLNVSWDFGDGSTSREPSGSHLYSGAGTFAVRVTAQDDEGASSTRTFTVRVSERPGPPPHDGGGNGTAQRAPLLAGPLAYGLGSALIIVLVAGMAMMWRGRRQDV